MGGGLVPWLITSILSEDGSVRPAVAAVAWDTPGRLQGKLAPPDPSLLFRLYLRPPRALDSSLLACP